MAIPEDCIHTTIHGVELQFIDSAKGELLIDEDPDDNLYHSCILSNGIFIFKSENNILSSLYRVIQE